jgi:hypothetical protein
MMDAGELVEVFLGLLAFTVNDIWYVPAGKVN